MKLFALLILAALIQAPIPTPQRAPGGTNPPPQPPIECNGHGCSFLRGPVDPTPRYPGPKKGVIR